MSASGADGSSVTVNIPTAGRIPGGATVERAVATPFASGDSLTLNLRDGDFTTAKRVADAINKSAGAGVAQAIDASSIRVHAPMDALERVDFVATIENLEVRSADAVARVIVNARTGTVIINSAVRVSPAAVSHGNLIVTISESPQVSQPQPFARGRTVVTPQSDVQVTQEGGSRMFLSQAGRLARRAGPGREPGRCGPGRRRRDPRCPEAGRGAQGRARGDLRWPAARARSTPTSPACRS